MKELYKEKLLNLHTSLNIIRVTESRKDKLGRVYSTHGGYDKYRYILNFSRKL